MEKKWKRMQQVRIGHPDTNNASPICIYEFRGKGKCSNKAECTFSHEITEEQRNNEQVRNEIAAKVSSLRQRRNTTFPQAAQTEQANEEKILVPVNVLHQLYTILDKSVSNRF